MKGGKIQNRRVLTIRKYGHNRRTAQTITWVKEQLFTFLISRTTTIHIA